MLRHVAQELRENPGVCALAAVGVAKGLYEAYVSPQRPATKAWGALALGIIAYELLCPPNETMSEGADRLIERYPLAARVAIGGLGLALTTHVANIAPSRFDIIHRSFKFIKEAL